jgi:hypothetical protein
MKILCAIDRTPCGDGASGPCLANHPDKCPCKYIEPPKVQRKPKKQREVEQYEEEAEEWKL